MAGGPDLPPPAAPPPPPAGPPVSPQPAPQPRPLTEGLEYHQLYRAGRRDLWWLGFASPVVVLAFLLLGSVLVIVPFVAWAVLSGRDVMGVIDEISNLDDPTPLSLAYLDLSIAIVIPMTFLLVWAIHGLKPGWLTSIRPRMRWGWFALCILLSVAALGATLLVGAFLPAPESAAAISQEPNPFTRTMFDFFLIVLLLTPFQAAAEEYLFRGYLTQAVGSLFPARGMALAARTVAVVVPALIFAVMHGIGQEAPVFFDRFAFGVVAGVLVIATGGLEAAIAMHVLNNYLAFSLALLFGDLASAFNPTGSSWWMLPSTLTQSLVYLGLALLVGKSMGISRRAPLQPTG